MLEADPAAPLTIARAADAVGAAPMSLYRHVADRDDLVDAVTRYVFAGCRPSLPEGTSWQDELRAWMSATYETAMRVPQLVRHIAAGESSAGAWLADTAYLAGVLERSGMTDDAELADAVYWVATTTLGQAMLHAASPHDAPPDRWERGMEALDAAEATRVRRLMPYLSATHEDAFAHVVDRTIAALER